MVDKIYHVVSQVLGVPVEQLTPEDGPDTIEAWDSLAHINLVLALEAEFQVTLTPEDAADMLSIEAMRQILVAKGVVGLASVMGRG